MRNPQLRASFFVTSDGVAIPKARPLTTAVRLEVFEDEGRACGTCGHAVEFFTPRSCSFLTEDRRVAHVDHVFPRARGGQNNRRNLRLLCYKCNLSKAAD